MKTIPVTSGRLAVCSEGKGPSVIFLHGGPGDTHHYMKRMARPLSEEFHCIFFDQRGSGQSIVNRSPENFKINVLFDDLLAVKNHYRLDQVTLVGHSWGATYALFACMSFPEIFNKAVLLNMGPLNEEAERKTSENLLSNFTPSEKEEWSRIRSWRNAARDEGRCHEVKKADEQLMKIRVKSWVYNSDLREKFLAEYFQDPLPDREVNKWIWEAQAGWFSWDRLKATSSEIWICVGENDSVPVSQAKKVAEILPNSHLSVFAKCGHIPWLEHPADFYRRLGDFLESDI